MFDYFISVAENIHCTLIRKVGGKFAGQDEDGSYKVWWVDGGEKKALPVPDRFSQHDDWANGKVKHLAVGMWQAFYGEGEARETGIEYVKYWARTQEKFGGTYQDLNVDEFSTDVEERAKLIKVVAKIVQEESSLPLSIDSSNMDLLIAGLEECDTSRGKPMVNSVSLERQEAIDIAGKFNAVVIAGATGEEKMPDSVEERVENCIKVTEKLNKVGVANSEIHYDPLVFPVSVNKENGLHVIDTVKQLRDKYGSEIHFAPGLSNISYGMPNRKLINQVFTYECFKEGLDGGIVDPRHINLNVFKNMDESSEQYKLASDLVLGRDDFGMNYITASREGTV